MVFEHVEETFQSANERREKRKAFAFGEKLQEIGMFSKQKEILDPPSAFHQALMRWWYRYGYYIRNIGGALAVAAIFISSGP